MRSVPLSSLCAAQVAARSARAPVRGYASRSGGGKTDISAQILTFDASDTAAMREMMSKLMDDGGAEDGAQPHRATLLLPVFLCCIGGVCIRTAALSATVHVLRLVCRWQGGRRRRPAITHGQREVGRTVRRAGSMHLCVSRSGLPEHGLLWRRAC